jgi:hypothetical protein
MITSYDLLTSKRMITQFFLLGTAGIVLLSSLVKGSKHFSEVLWAVSPLIVLSFTEYLTRKLLASTAQKTEIEIKDQRIYVSRFAKLPYFSELFGFITQSAYERYSEAEIKFHCLRKQVARETWNPLFSFALVFLIIPKAGMWLQEYTKHQLVLPRIISDNSLEIYFLVMSISAIILHFLLIAKVDHKTVVNFQFKPQTASLYLTKLYQQPNDFAPGISFLKKLTIAFRLRKLRRSKLFNEELQDNLK